MAEKLTHTSTFPAVVGAVLQAHRKKLKKDQKDIADALELKSVSAWSKIENGDTALTIEQLALAALALQTTPSVVLEQAEECLRELSVKGVATPPTRTWLSGGSFVPLSGAALLSVVPVLGAVAGVATSVALASKRVSDFKTALSKTPRHVVLGEE